MDNEKKTVTRRELRMSLGSRTQKRSGRKTKCRPNTGTPQGCAIPKYKYRRWQMPRPRARLQALIRQKEQEGWKVT